MPEVMNRSDATLEPIFCSVTDAARLLALSPRFVYDILDKGAIESRYQGRKRLVVIESLRRYAEGLPTSPED